ncbi:metallophosphoesterase [Escherichia coli]|nr:metallophosphoesterase [Escherichia coli]
MDYLKIDGADWRKIFVCGDLHGCYDPLMAELERIGFDFEHDLLIAVGDLIDRGEQNVECLDLMNLPWFRSVAGNHEMMAWATIFGDLHPQHWVSNGGGWYYTCDADQAILARQLIARLPFLPNVIEVTTTSGQKIVVTHADYPDDVYQYGKEINWDQAHWSRQRIIKAKNGEPAGIAGADQFIFGHSPVKTPLAVENLLYIDTGAIWSKTLTILCIQGGE